MDLEVSTNSGSNPPIDGSGSKCRLGKCEVCAVKDAIYTCPKCELKTCCLPCQQIHKKELECTGIRDRTKFIAVRQMSKMDFMNDFYLLEECNRFVEARKHDPNKKYTQHRGNLSGQKSKMRQACAQRGINTRFLLHNFSRYKQNRSYFNKKKDLMYWTVKWVFINAENTRYLDKKCSENETLMSLLDKYLNINNVESISHKKKLEKYQSREIGSLSLLLKAEGIKGCWERYHRLDANETLKANLKGKEVVEFPVIYVAYDLRNSGFKIVSDEKELEADKQLYENQLQKIIKADKSEILHRRKRRQRKQAQAENKPKNFLFLNDGDESSTDSENETTKSQPTNNKL